MKCGLELTIIDLGESNQNQWQNNHLLIEWTPLNQWCNLSSLIGWDTNINLNNQQRWGRCDYNLRLKFVRSLGRILLIFGRPKNKITKFNSLKISKFCFDNNKEFGEISCTVYTRHYIWKSFFMCWRRHQLHCQQRISMKMYTFFLNWKQKWQLTA